MDESWEDVDWAELMAEPPGGVNHGRRKTWTGRWVPLEATDFSYLKDHGQPVPATEIQLSVKRYVSYKHGTLHGYVIAKCRCQDCRSRWADYMRERRRKQRGDG